MASEGLWHYLADGTCLWRLSIVSQGAASQILIFRSDQCTLTTLRPQESNLLCTHRIGCVICQLTGTGENVMQTELPPPFTSLQHVLGSAVSWVCHGAAR